MNKSNCIASILYSYWNKSKEIYYLPEDDTDFVRIVYVNNELAAFNDLNQLYWQENNQSENYPYRIIYCDLRSDELWLVRQFYKSKAFEKYPIELFIRFNPEHINDDDSFYFELFQDALDKYKLQSI
jgi:hypothetical protein